MSKIKNKILYGILLVSVFSIYTDTYAAWTDLFDIFTGEKDPASKDGIALTESEVIAGLREALAIGTKSAVYNLGRTDGFFRNPRVKIPIPGTLQKAESALRKINQDKIADDFVLAMNRAAEQAVPQATEIFSMAIQQMTFDDAKRILKGPDNAATEYFRQTSSDALTDKMLPIVRNSTSKVGVTARYKEMIDKLGFATAFIDEQSLDLDKYITVKAVEGLFKMLADEEKQIRNDPAARTTELLRKVFTKS